MMVDHLTEIQRAVDLLVEMVYSLVQSQVPACTMCCALGFLSLI